MKNILMALVITGIAYSGAEAQSCGLVPKHICKISPDRRSVNCYDAVHGVNVATPYQESAHVQSSATSCYKTGAVTNATTKLVVIKSDEPKNVCKRDDANKVSECTHTGYTICRDNNGLYNYCKLPLATESGSLSSR